MVLGYSAYEYTRTPCDTVLEYSIGRFDTNFGVSQIQFKNYVAQSELAWEKEVGKELFKYNPEAKFKINLIYDERQKATILKQRTESGLDAAETTLQSLDARLALFKSEYDRQVKAFDVMKENLDTLSNEYEKQVEYWNSHGGAPKGEYEKLEAMRQSINTSVSQINNEASSINSMAKQLNTIVEERNTAAKNYNKAAESYNSAYGDRAEFNQAEYTGKEINVYQFDSSVGLIMAMTHEFGHALDMDHVENSESIMYYLRDSDNTFSSPILTEEDKAELRKACRL